MGNVHYDDKVALKLVVGDERASITARVQVTDIGDNKCVLQNDYVRTVHMHNTNDVKAHNTAFEFPCYHQNSQFIVGHVCANVVTVSDAVNEAHSPINDAHAHGTLFFDFFTRRYNMVHARVSTNHMCAFTIICSTAHQFWPNCSHVHTGANP